MARRMNDVMEATVHVRFAGRSFDIPMPMLGIGPAWPDDQIKRALARHIEVPEGAFKAYVIDRHPNGNLTVRPEAVFG